MLASSRTLIFTQGLADRYKKTTTKNQCDPFIFLLSVFTYIEIKYAGEEQLEDR